MALSSLCAVNWYFAITGSSLKNAVVASALTGLSIIFLVDYIKER